MSQNVPAERLRLIEKIVAAARRAAAPRRLAPLAEEFLRAYFHGVAEEDLAARDPSYLASVALDHLGRGGSRRAERPIVRVFSPDAEREGFSSPHTLVEVVTRDMPFLVDSVSIVFSRAGIGIHLIVHPVLAVERGAHGRIASAQLWDRAPTDDAAAARSRRPESWQLYEIDRQLDPQAMRTIERRLLATLEDVRLAVTDWPRIVAKAHAVASTIEAADAGALLEWMADDHFTFLGYRH
jgi:glutamate dehydrogenase